MKLFYKLLIIFFIIVSILIYIEMSIQEVKVSLSEKKINNYVKNIEDTIVEKKEQLVISDVINLNSVEPLNKMYKVDNANIYMLSYVPEGINIEKANKIKLSDKYVSDQLEIVFRESYPNVSLEELGLETEEEAYQVTQLAIWEVGLRTGEALYGSELSKIESIRRNIGNKNVNAKVFEKANSLVNMVEKYNSEDDDNVFDKSGLVLNSKNTTMYGNIIGPFYYDLDFGVISEATVEFEDKNGNKLTDLEVVDSNGEIIENLNNTNEFYIKYLGERYEFVCFTLKVKYKEIVVSLYNDGDMDYLLNTYVNDELETKHTINIEK